LMRSAVKRQRAPHRYSELPASPHEPSVTHRAPPVSYAMYQGSGQATPCSQSQIGQVGDLRREKTGAGEEALALSVVVRWGPAETAVNGTVVARPARTTWHKAPRPGSTSTVG
jgi:hypothetical protein